MLESEARTIYQDVTGAEDDSEFEQFWGEINKSLDFIGFGVRRVAYKHDDNKSELVQIDNETVATKIDINDYTIWTRNEDENKRLEVANELIDVLDKVGSFSKVYPLTITQGISNFLLFDTAKHQYKVNRTIIPQHI